MTNENDTKRKKVGVIDRSRRHSGGQDKPIVGIYRGMFFEAIGEGLKWETLQDIFFGQPNLTS